MKCISRRNFLKAMGISATALTLAACGGSSSSTAASTAGSTAGSTAAAAATGEPKAGGTLRLCYSSPIATPGYTPRASGNAAIYYLTLSYESLVSYDAEGNLKAEYTIEGMHMYANGYRPVMDALLPLLRKIGKEQGEAA